MLGRAIFVAPKADKLYTKFSRGDEEVHISAINWRISAPGTEYWRSLLESIAHQVGEMMLILRANWIGLLPQDRGAIGNKGVKVANYGPAIVVPSREVNYAADCAIVARFIAGGRIVHYDWQIGETGFPSPREKVSIFAIPGKDRFVLVLRKEAHTSPLALSSTDHVAKLRVIPIEDQHSALDVVQHHHLSMREYARHAHRVELDVGQVGVDLQFIHHIVLIARGRTFSKR